MTKLFMPTPYPDGRVQTLNNMGAMSTSIDQVTAQYLNFLEHSNSSTVALEIGTAYGAIVLNTLKNSNVNIFANDLDEGHLQILEDNAQACCSDQMHRLKTEASDFPQGFTISNQEFDAILIARVAHFFSPAKLEASIDKFHEILKPSGCVYMIGITPYVNRFASFIPVYEQGIKDNSTWPGYVTNLQSYANRDLTPDKVYANLKDKEFHFFSSNLLQKLFESKGFNVSYANDFQIAYESTEWSYDGRELAGVIACKPGNFFESSTESEL